eukprot:488795-Pyramimonas_sp.AAC.1
MRMHRRMNEIQGNPDVAATSALPGAAQGRHINQSEIDMCTLGSTCTRSTVRSNPMCRPHYFHPPVLLSAIPSPARCPHYCHPPVCYPHYCHPPVPLSVLLSPAGPAVRITVTRPLSALLSPAGPAFRITVTCPLSALLSPAGPA